MSLLTNSAHWGNRNWVKSNINHQLGVYDNGPLHVLVVITADGVTGKSEGADFIGLERNQYYASGFDAIVNKNSSMLQAEAVNDIAAFQFQNNGIGI